MTMTTIKVSPEVRDQLNELAAERGIPVNTVVDRLLTRAMRDLRLQQIRRRWAEDPAKQHDSEWLIEFGPVPEEWGTTQW